MLGAVQFDGDARIGAEQIDFQRRRAVERDRQRGVQPKPPLGFGQRLEPSEQERLRRAPRAVGAVGIRRNVRAACTNRLASGVSTPSRTSRRTLPE